MNNIDEKFIQILESIKFPKNISFNGEITLKDDTLFKIALRKWLEKHPEKSVGEVLLLLEKHGFVTLNSLTLQVNENQKERLEREKENSISNVPTMHENYDLGFAVMDIKETRAAMDINENTAAKEAKLKYWKRHGRK